MIGEKMPAKETIRMGLLFRAFIVAAILFALAYYFGLLNAIIAPWVPVSDQTTQLQQQS